MQCLHECGLGMSKSQSLQRYLVGHNTIHQPADTQAMLSSGAEADETYRYEMHYAPMAPAVSANAESR